jgi:heptosyltransferase-2
MQTINDLTILSSTSLHVSKNDASVLQENIQAQIKPGDRILILALSGIGDALMCTPALRILKESFPENHFDVLTMFKGIADIFSTNPDISKVLFWNFLKESPFKTLNFLFSLRGTYSHTITGFPANRFHYAIVARLISSKYRIGHRYLHNSISQLNALNNILLNEKNELHNCEENIRIATVLGAKLPKTLPPMSLHLSQRDTEFAKEWISNNGLKDASLFGIHAGSAIVKNQIHKRWNAEHYAELCAKASSEIDMAILLFGGPEEKELNERISNAILAKHSSARVIIVEASSLSQSIAIMKHCSAFVSNDSGLMHCAAALQLPLIAIFGYTSHVHTAPWNNPRAMIARRDLACSPCFYFSPKPASCKYDGTDKAFTCIRDISPIHIFQSLKEIIS